MYYINSSASTANTLLGSYRKQCKPQLAGLPCKLCTIVYRHSAARFSPFDTLYKVSKEGESSAPKQCCLRKQSEVASAAVTLGGSYRRLADASASVCQGVPSRCPVDHRLGLSLARRLLQRGTLSVLF